MPPGTSPHHVNTPTPGRYSILVLGRDGDQEASLLLWFQVLPSSGRLDVSIIQQSIAANASVLVTFAANRLDVEFQCSTGDAPFQRCEPIPHTSILHILILPYLLVNLLGLCAIHNNFMFSYSVVPCCVYVYHASMLIPPCSHAAIL